MKNIEICAKALQDRISQNRGGVAGEKVQGYIASAIDRVIKLTGTNQLTTQQALKLQESGVEWKELKIVTLARGGYGINKSNDLDSTRCTMCIQTWIELRNEGARLAYQCQGRRRKCCKIFCLCCMYDITTEAENCFYCLERIKLPRGYENGIINQRICAKLTGRRTGDAKGTIQACQIQIKQTADRGSPLTFSNMSLGNTFEVEMVNLVTMKILFFQLNQLITIFLIQKN
eukprot:51723_1